MANENEKKTPFDYESEIWAVANFVWGPIKTSEFNRVILPFTMLRRLECALEPTRDAVVKAFEENEKDWGRENDHYCDFSKKAFYNITSFRLNSLGSVDTLDALMEYINGFSPNAREIMLRFKMEETCKTLQEHGMLYSVCTKFAGFDLSPENVSDRDMSNIYEHLIQKFGESIAENAEDFMTPKDVVRLAVGMIFANDVELLSSDEGVVRTLYDPTMGTGGFITDALDQLEEWQAEKKMKAPATIVAYGQEVEPESWAMGKAALLLRNVGAKDKDIHDQIKDMSAHIMYGNTLNEDKFEYDRFDYILSNPPYGKEWKPEQEDVLAEARLGFAGRFGAGTPSVDDGSMLFLQHVVSKMKRPNADGTGGSRAGIVLSASPLFTGDAGSGPSNIRRWLFEKDVIDCIVKLPQSIFFRTGINTYLWILNSNKPEDRKGMIQLIDASEMKTSMKKNQGNKRFELSVDQRNWIIQTYIDGHDHGNSVLVPKETFMYRKVTTQRPLHAVIRFTEASVSEMLACKPLAKLSGANRDVLRSILTQEYVFTGKNQISYESADSVAKATRAKMRNPEITAAVIAKAMRDYCIVKGPEFPVVYDKNGCVMPDPDLKDSESIPFGTSFDSYMKAEVLPYAPETWIDETVVDKGPLQDKKVGIVGVKISFNKYFYKYAPHFIPSILSERIENIKEHLPNLSYSWDDITKRYSNGNTVDSGIPWIPHIPEEWDVIPLKYLFGERKHKNTDGIEQNLLSLSYGRIIRKDICRTEGLIPENYNGYNIVESGDIVLRLTDLQNDTKSLRTGLVTERGIVTSAYVSLMPKRKLNSAFYRYVLHTYDLKKVFYSMGEGIRQSLTYDELSRILLPCPPIEVQDAIVMELNNASETIDCFIKEQQKVLALLEEYKRAVIQSVFVDGVKG